MNIGRVRTVRVPGDETAVSRTEQKKVKEAAGDQGGENRKADRVVISEDARARLAELADAARSEGITAPAPEADEGIRIEKVRLAMARIRSGYYNRPEIQQQIADRLADEWRTRPPEEPDEPEQK